jgi:hypothetical protein
MRTEGSDGFVPHAGDMKEGLAAPNEVSFVTIDLSGGHHGAVDAKEHQ